MTKNTTAKAPATAPGAGTAYETAASGSENENGKASATAAGGDPVNSPVIGNPGEARPDMSYDYGLAAKVDQGAAQQASQRLKSVEVLPKIVPGSAEDTTDYAELVRARQKGHYDGVKEVGEVFNNHRNLPTYPEDPTSWFEDAERDPEWESKEQNTRRRGR